MFSRYEWMQWTGIFCDKYSRKIASLFRVKANCCKVENFRPKTIWVIAMGILFSVGHLLVSPKVFSTLLGKRQVWNLDPDESVDQFLIQVMLICRYYDWLSQVLQMWLRLTEKITGRSEIRLGLYYTVLPTLFYWVQLRFDYLTRERAHAQTRRQSPL